MYDVSYYVWGAKRNILNSLLNHANGFINCALQSGHSNINYGAISSIDKIYSKRNGRIRSDCQDDACEALKRFLGRSKVKLTNLRKYRNWSKIQLINQANKNLFVNQTFMNKINSGCTLAPHFGLPSKEWRFYFPFCFQKMAPIALLIVSSFVQKWFLFTQMTSRKRPGRFKPALYFQLWSEKPNSVEGNLFRKFLALTKSRSSLL